ncbi:hypothetical protein BTHI11S_00006 [Bosea thiooxidans]
MAKAGRGGPALATSAFGSFVAGLITIGLAFLAPWLVELAVKFGPWDYFALMIVAFVTVSATFGDLPLRGLTSLLIGITLGLVGIDKLTGQARLTYGVPELLNRVRSPHSPSASSRWARPSTSPRSASATQRRSSRSRLAAHDQAGLEALRRSGCAAPPSASRSAPCRPAAPRSRPF